MSTSSRLSIGEFSRLTWLSAKALRLYERRGLLLPDLVDEYTGYRYYRESQAQRARSIALLRRAGMPLDRIGAVLDASEGDRSALLDAYRTETVHAHERNLALLDNVAIALGAEAPPMPDHSPEVLSRDVEAQAFVARTLHTTAAELPAHIEEAARAMAQRAGAAIDHDQPLVVVYHGEVGWESDGPVEVRVPVTDNAVADGVEPAGSEFYVDVPLGEVQFPTILRSFDAVRAAASRGACRPSGHPREVYFDGDPFRCQVAQRYRVPTRP